MPVNNYEPDFERECILVNKVYNEWLWLIAQPIAFRFLRFPTSSQCSGLKLLILKLLA